MPPRSALGSSVALAREDGMLLARFPHNDRVGVTTVEATTERVLGGRRHYPRASSAPTAQMTTPLRPDIAKLPVVDHGQSEQRESVLFGWRRTAELLMIMSAVCAMIVLTWPLSSLHAGGARASAPSLRRKPPIGRSHPSWRDEPRNPHADERRARPRQTLMDTNLDSGATQHGSRDLRRRRQPAGDTERHSGFLEA